MIRALLRGGSGIDACGALFPVCRRSAYGAAVGDRRASSHRGGRGQPGRSSVDKSALRIRSDQPPERVVFDTTQPTIVPRSRLPAVAARAAGPAPGRCRRPGPCARDLCPVRAGRGEEARAQAQRKRKVAKVRPAPPMQIAQSPRMRVAQQSQYQASSAVRTGTPPGKVRRLIQFSAAASESYPQNRCSRSAARLPP